jgi:hypothetical protein
LFQEVVTHPHRSWERQQGPRERQQGPRAR